jgi:adenosine deaminase
MAWNSQLQIYRGVLLEKMRDLMGTGVRVTVNSDDPPFFGGYVNENFVFWAEHIGLTPEKIYELAANSFQYSFVPDEQRRALLGRLDAAWSAAMGTDTPKGRAYREAPYVHPDDAPRRRGEVRSRSGEE